MTTGGAVRLLYGTAPATPTSGKVLLYSADGTVLRVKNDSGVDCALAKYHIETQVAGVGGVSNFNFTAGFSNTLYRAYELIVKSRSATTGSGTEFQVQFNGDTGSKYQAQYIQGYSTTLVTGLGGTATAGGIGKQPQASVEAGNFGMTRVLIPYADANMFINWESECTWFTTTTVLIRYGGRATIYGPITSIKLISGDGGNFVQYSFASLYGVVG